MTARNCYSDRIDATMKLEDSGLPPFLVYLTARLTGRPLGTIFWLIGMLSIFLLVLFAEIEPQDPAYGKAIGLEIFTAFLILVLVVALISIAVRKEGRDWLTAKLDGGTGEAVSLGSRLIVWLLPMLGLVVLLENWILR
jgi:hypothetical protein